MAPLTAAERMAVTRARRRGEMAAAPTCKVCGVPIKNSGNGRAFHAGLCYTHWKDTPDAKKYTSEQRKLKRDAKNGPTMFRYWACRPGQEDIKIGPFNRMRLAVSSTYVGKNKPRGKLWIVWSDDIVTEHENVKQVNIGKKSIDPETGKPGLEKEEWRYRGRIIDGFDEYVQRSKNEDPITERFSNQGHEDEYLLNDR